MSEIQAAYKKVTELWEKDPAIPHLEPSELGDLGVVVAENLRLLVEDLSWIPTEVREDVDFLEVRIRISLSELEGQRHIREAGERAREVEARAQYDAAREQVSGLLEG